MSTDVTPTSAAALGEDLERFRRVTRVLETTQDELEEKVIRRLTQLGFAEDSNGVYRFLPPMHRFLDVCLSVQQDRDLAAALHSSDLPLPAPTLVVDDDDILVDDEESEEAALARAIAEEKESLA